MEPKKKEAIMNLLFLLSIVAAIILLNKYFLTEKPGLEYCLSYSNASECSAVFTPDPAAKVQDGLCYFNCTNDITTCQNRSLACKWVLNVKETK